MVQFHVTLASETVASASRQSQALERILQEHSLGAEIRRVKTSHSHMDGGATLAIILASPVLIAFARALQIFLQRHNSSSITIKRDGTVIAENISAKDASRIIDLLQNSE